MVVDTEEAFAVFVVTGTGTGTPTAPLSLGTADLLAVMAVHIGDLRVTGTRA